MSVFRTVTLRDGRTLEYVDLGDPDGTRAVYLAGSPGTAAAAEIVAEPAQRHGVRLVAPSRPGYGASTCSPPGLASTAADVLELVDLLGLERFAVLGSSGGGPFALAVAAAAPGRVTMAGLHGSPGPYAELSPDALDDADRRAIELLAAGDVDGAVAVETSGAESMFGHLQGLSPEDFSAELSKVTPPGENWFDSRPGLRTVFEADFQRAIVTFDGFVRDNLSWLAPWDIDLTTVTVPVRLVYGEGDQMVPKVHGEWLHERLPTSTLHVVPGGHGHATFGGVEETFGLL